MRIDGEDIHGAQGEGKKNVAEKLARKPLTMI